MEPKIIFEDQSILILDKPSGWIVNEVETFKGQPVVQTWLKKLSYNLVNKAEFRSGIVHRLDKETSGVLIVAKTAKAFNRLQRQFKERQVEKAYVALVHGRVVPEAGTIIAPVGRLPWRRDRFGVLPGGREAETKYRARGYLKKNDKDYTLLLLKPVTGRTHQIRIHLKYVGHAIVSDEFYAGRKIARDDRKWCPRLFLHANEISFSHPETGKRVNFRSELPPGLQGCLKSFHK